MENRLTKLFDYQKFAGNKRLQAAIDSVRKSPRELSLDDVELVMAAYAPYVKANTDEKKDSKL